MVMLLGISKNKIYYVVNSFLIYYDFRPSLSSTSSRPTILPTYSNGIDSHSNNNNNNNDIDPSFRVMRCTSMDTIRRNDQIPLINSNDKLRTDTLLKQKMCSSKKYNHIPVSGTLPSESLRSQSFSTATTTAPATNLNHQQSLNRHHYQNGDFSLQKPRVYTHDDRAFLGQQQQQQQNILSSSSASSTLSVKDKNIKEMNETRYDLFSCFDICLFENNIFVIIEFKFFSRSMCFAYCFGFMH